MRKWIKSPMCQCYSVCVVKAITLLWLEVMEAQCFSNTGSLNEAIIYWLSPSSPKQGSAEGEGLDPLTEDQIYKALIQVFNSQNTQSHICTGMYQHAQRFWIQTGTQSNQYTENFKGNVCTLKPGNISHSCTCRLHCNEGNREGTLNCSWKTRWFSHCPDVQPCVCSAWLFLLLLLLSAVVKSHSWTFILWQASFQIRLGDKGLKLYF